MARTSVETAMGKESFFFASETFPANNVFFVRGRYKRVEVFHFAITFGASLGWFCGDFGVYCFDHFVRFNQMN